MTTTRTSAEDLYGNEIRAAYKARRSRVSAVEHDRLLVIKLAQDYMMSTKRIRAIIADISAPPPVLSTWKPKGRPAFKAQTRRNDAIVNAYMTGKLTQAELAEKYEISPQRVRQIVARAIKRSQG